MSNVSDALSRSEVLFWVLHHCSLFYAAIKGVNFLRPEASQCLEEEELSGFAQQIIQHISKMFFYQIRAFNESNDRYFKKNELGGNRVSMSAFMLCRSIVLRIGSLLSA